MFLHFRKNKNKVLTINNVCILQYVCNEKVEEVWVEGAENQVGQCVCVCFGIAGHSTAPKGESQSGWEGDGGGRVTRRRCMKAKALQTIVTLYMTSSCYNNTAVIYCTVQVRLNIWLDKADHHHLQYPQTSVLPWLFCFFNLFSCLSIPFVIFVFAHKQYMGLHIYIPLTQHGRKKINITKKKQKKTYKSYMSEFWWGAFILYIQILLFFFSSFFCFCF